MDMFEVCAKCGHVGRNYYVDKIFAVKAINGKEAAKKARMIPRVKHDHKDAIRYVKKIDEGRYWEIINNNNYDPFLRCKSIQEQRKICDAILKQKENTISYGEKKSAKRPKLTERRMSSSNLITSYWEDILY